MNNSPQTPLELYERAYRLQYEEKKISEACRIYKQIIDEFPESNECAYAVIQLEKIISETVSERINTSSNFLKVLSILSIIISIAAVLIIIIQSYFLQKNITSRITALSLATRAVSISWNGKDSEALDLLKEAKSYNKNEITPYLISSDIYLRNRQYSKAILELENIKNIAGISAFVNQQIDRIKEEEKNSNIRKYKLNSQETQEQSNIQQSEETLVKEPENSVKEDAKSFVNVKKKNVVPQPKPQKQKKSSLGQDSISFF
jgi:tetratricopeptide (TPR) repeat protein